MATLLGEEGAIFSFSFSLSLSFTFSFEFLLVTDGEDDEGEEVEVEALVFRGEVLVESFATLFGEGCEAVAFEAVIS